MSDVTGSKPGNTYKQLLQVGAGNSGLSGSLQTVQDCGGNNSALKLSTVAVEVAATTITINGQTLTVTGTSSINGTFSGTTSGTHSGTSSNTNTGDQTTSGTANEITVATGTTNPVISIPTAVTFTGKTITGGTYSTPTINTATIEGGTIGSVTPATIIKVDNITLDGNTVSTTDSNGNLVLTPNGTGDIQLGGDSGFKDSSGNYYIDFTKTASAVNYWTIVNYSAGSGPQLTTAGSDTNINAIIQGKGNLGVDLYGGATASVATRWFIFGTSKRLDHNIAALSTTRTITWPDKDVTFGSGIVQKVYSQDGAVATGSTVLPWDDTIPQNTEGDQYMSLSITPTNSANTLLIEFNGQVAISTTGVVSAALFQDSTANALTASALNIANTNTVGLVLRHKMTAGTTSATTFKIRMGPGSAATTTFNGTAGARKFGGVSSSMLTITELF